MIKDEAGDAEIAKVPLWLFPLILLSILGLTSAFIVVDRLVSPPTGLGWLLAPRQIGIVGYTLMGALVAGVIWLWAARGGFARRVAPFDWPKPRYWLWVIIGFAVEIAAAYALLPIINDLGPLRGRDYSLADPRVFALVTVWAVLIGPVCEEIVFRGFGMGYLIARGLNPWLAGLIVLVIFLFTHWPAFGFSAMLLVLPVSVLITVFRIVSGNLTPGLMLHMLNNIFAFLVLPALRAHAGA